MLCRNRRSERCVSNYWMHVRYKLISTRQVIQQATGQQVSQPVAQIIAGFAKVFVGEMVEKGASRVDFFSV